MNRPSTSDTTKQQQSDGGYYLVDIREQTTEGVLQIPMAIGSAGKPNADIFPLTLELQPGDLVYLEGQVEIDWRSDFQAQNNREAVLFAIRIKRKGVDGELSHRSSQNIIGPMEHLPLRVSCLYRHDSDSKEQITFVINANVGNLEGNELIDKDKPLGIPAGYGHLLAEVYRPISSLRT